MTEMFFIRPTVDGARLHDPLTNDVLAADGEKKPRDHYWLLCLARGDVVETEALDEAAKEPALPAVKPPAMPAKPIAVSVAS